MRANLVEDQAVQAQSEVGGEGLPSYHSTEAVSARIRWLVEENFAEGERLRPFSDASGISVSRVKNLMYGINMPNSDDLEVICDFFQVNPEFILWGRLTNMRYELRSEIHGNERLRRLMESKRVPLPGYLAHKV